MADTLQIVGAAFNLAGLAIRTAGLLRHLVEARAEAQALYHKTLHVHSLSKRIGTLLESREQNPSSASGVEISVIKSTLKAIGESLQACDGALQIVNAKVKPLVRHRGKALPERVKHLWSAKEIKTQEDIMITHVQLLAVDVIMLNGLDSSIGLKALQGTLLQTTGKHQLNGSEHSSDITLEERLSTDSPISDEDDIHPEIPEASHSELNGETRCPNCSVVLVDPVCIAVQQSSAHDVQLLVEDKFGIEYLDTDGWTTLHHACHRLDHATMSQLLQSPGGSEPTYLNAKTHRGHTALMLVAMQAEASESLRIAEGLIKAQCDLDVKDESEETPRSALHMVVNEPKTPRKAEFVELLIASGADTASVRKTLPGATERKYLKQFHKAGDQNAHEDTVVEDGEADDESRKESRFGFRRLSKKLSRSGA